MNNLSKIVLTGSIVLGAALFSIGCGGNSKCCDKNVIKAEVNLLAENNLNNNILPANTSLLTVNGLGSSSDGTITKAVWTVYSDCTKTTVIDAETVTSSDPKGKKVQLDLGTPGVHKVCVVVYDTNELSDEDCKCITVPETTGPTPVISPTTVKAGCPLDGSSSVSHSDPATIKSYKWTLNSLGGTTVSTTANYTVPNPTSATQVCLLVTDQNDESNGQCWPIEAHEPPVAVLHVFRDKDLTENVTDYEEVNDGGVLQFGDDLSLTCAGSHDDCPIAENGRAIPQNGGTTNGTCEFNGSSYESTAEDCSVLPTTGTVYVDSSTPAPYYYKENCKLSGELKQSSSTAGTVSVNMCGTQVFHCVRFWVDVTDEFGGTSRATKTFRVQ